MALNFIFSFSISALVMRQCIRRGGDIKINEYDETIRKLHSVMFLGVENFKQKFDNQCFDNRNLYKFLLIF
jgi:hypothetical protein